MARALSDILTELDTTYNPLKSKQQEIYDQGVNSLAPQETADLSGLEQAKQDSFSQITTGANRRGLFYSGIPIAEQAKYVGSTYLPSVANLKGRYAGLRGQLANTLAQALANLDLDRLKTAEGIRGREIEADLERERMAQEAASRAASGGSGSGGIFPTFTGVQGAQTGPQLSLRQQWQQEADAGDWNAQVALNYAGDDGRFDGVVNSKAEYDILKKMGIVGNYTYRGQPLTVSRNTIATTPAGTTSLSGGSTGLQVLGGGGSRGGW